jgi:hypothetical protein
MPLRDLTDAEQKVVFECLRCVASGRVILNDWEFPILFGIDFATLQTIVGAIPKIDDSSQEVFLAINNTFNNLLGYPHGKELMWHEFISVAPTQVEHIFTKWRGDTLQNPLSQLE